MQKWKMKRLLDIEKRFRRYESVSHHSLITRIPVIIRLDGNAFHTFTKKYWGKSYSEEFAVLMARTTRNVMYKMSGAKFAYIQSDEVSILLTDFDDLSTQAWFDYDLNKLVSVSAGMFSAIFNDNNVSKRCPEDPVGWFDARAFNLDKSEVPNYFIWRQLDCIRNSKQMLAREHFSHKQLLNKSCDEICKMVYQEKGVNWFDLPDERIYGICIHKNEGLEIAPAPVFQYKEKMIAKCLGIDE